ncbi:MAG TPA: MBL fold metallo-hydrolase [Flavisolibacter sp.]|jgi:glyoxylase-like metal-dependent hydrolase (beta-lactamase superfamily II)|nr:MBL fold metallo-hydrolase [Flavisolibacter sp.]
MKISVLPVTYRYQDKEDVLYPVLLQHRNEAILVDCGYEDSLPQLEKALEAAGSSLSQLTGIVLTHHDIDHIGGASQIKRDYPSLPVYASAIEANYINGKEKSLRLQQAEDIFTCLPDEHKPAALAFQTFLQTVKPVPVDHILAENCKWPLAGEVEVIPTPGHTPGHISLYVKKEQTLIAADAVVVEEGRLNLANPQYALELPKAVESVEKIRQMNIQKLVCYHGGSWVHNVNEALAVLLAKWQPVSDRVVK